MILTGQTRANKDHVVKQAKARHFKSSRKGSAAEEKRGNVHFFEPELGPVRWNSHVLSFKLDFLHRNLLE